MRFRSANFSHGRKIDCKVVLFKFDEMGGFLMVIEDVVVKLYVTV